MKTLRCTSTLGLVVRAIPERGGTDTGRRIRSGELVTSHGASYDGKWAHVVVPGGEGWASVDYLDEAAEPTPQISETPAIPDTEAFANAAGIAPAVAQRWYPYVIEAAKRFDFASRPRLAMWIAQCAHESQGFSRVTENLNYSAEALHQTWPTRFPTVESAQPYARRPEKIANKVYADRMGNGPEASGDGWKYRGRGLVQITGRDNYQACGKALELDLVNSPDLATSDQVAALSAGWFWSTRGLNAFADAGDIQGATKAINGGLSGLDDRKTRWAHAKKVLGVT